jgi:hypothetical protein
MPLQPTFPLLTTSCNLELIDSEVLAALDFLTGAILLDELVSFLEVSRKERLDRIEKVKPSSMF